MSKRNKRRRISNEGSNEENLETFRFELLKILLKFHHSLQYHLGHWYQKDFLTLSDEEKVEQLLKIDKKTGIEGIGNTLRRENAKNLRTLHTHICNKKMNKSRVCQNLARHFYGEILDQKKRNEEKENLSSFDLNIDYRFQKLCETVVTFEIMQIIFSYVGINSESFFSVSSVNKTFYIYALRCFHEIKLTKANLYQVSTLALRSTRRVEVDVMYKKDKYSTKELNYIFDELSHNHNLKFIRLSIPASLIEGFLKTLHRFILKPVNNSRSITNVENLEFHLSFFEKYEHREVCDSKKYDSPKKVKLSDIFNNLRKVTAHLSLIMLQGMNTVESLVLGFEYKPYYINRTMNYAEYDEEQLNCVFSVQRLKHIDTENLKTLTLRMPALRSTTYDFLFNDDQFSKLEEIRFLPCYVGHVSEPKKLLDFSDYLRSSISADHPCLRTLVIRIPMDYQGLIEKNRRESNQDNMVSFQLPNNHPSIENLEVYFIDTTPNYGSYGTTSPFDTTFGAISRWEGLKSFRGTLTHFLVGGAGSEDSFLKEELFDRMDSFYLELQLESERTLLKIDWKKKRRAFHGGSVVIKGEAEVDIVFMGDDFMNRIKPGGKIKSDILRELLEMLMQKYESDDDTNNVKLLRMRVLVEKGFEENAEVKYILGNCKSCKFETKKLEVLKVFPERYHDQMKENARRGRSRDRHSEAFPRYECEFLVYKFERQ